MNQSKTSSKSYRKDTAKAGKTAKFHQLFASGRVYIGTSSASKTPSGLQPVWPQSATQLGAVGAELETELASDQQPLNLGGAFADFAQLGVAQETLRREILDVSVAAMDLDAEIAYF